MGNKSIKNTKFQEDLYPGRPRILFVGFAESSHTHSWVDLLQSSTFNVRVFCLPSAVPPQDWGVKCYITKPGHPERYATPNRQTVYPPVQNSAYGFIFKLRGWLRGGQQVITNRIIRGALGRALDFSEKLLKGNQASTIEESLTEIIKEWRPDVVHTLGFDPASYLYLNARKLHGLECIGRWVAQARGGPDLALQRYSPDFLPRILEVLKNCDHFIADNQQNYDYVKSIGIGSEKTSNPGMGVVSGAGGMDIGAFREMWTLPPSQRERVIVWPKAYETYTAKAMPVFEAILKVWDRLQPCRIEMLWMTQAEVQLWYQILFPKEKQESCPAFGRLGRDETLARIAKARVMLAPSLSDGIPNTMMEAMALGAVPLVSPLDTIVTVVKNEENVLFARNLYPDEIAEALVRLMEDDELVDRMAQNNLVRIKEMADRDRVRERALVFYDDVARINQQSNAAQI
jgi:glycosyltransferase involved in cell wall biosynthesis